MDMTKFAGAYNEVNRNFVQAVGQNDITRFNKLAEKADLMFKTYSYTAGQMRQIYTALTGNDTVEVIKSDDPRRMIDHDNERVFMRMYLQPDFLRHASPAPIMQTWGSPYFRRVSGSGVEGTFSHIESTEVIKKSKAISTYGYDLLGLIQEFAIKEVLDKEDQAGYLKDYYLLAAQEATAIGTGILATTDTLYEAEPHIYIKNLIKLHGSAKRNLQPRALFVVPDTLWMDIYTIDQDIVNSISREGIDKGFGDKSNSEIFEQRTLRFTDDRYLSYDGGNTGGSHFVGGTKAGLAVFGYQTNGVGAPAELAQVTAYGFDPTVYLTWTTTAGSQTPLAECSFKRIMVYAPAPWVGGMYLDEPDLKTSVRYENGYVLIKAMEDLAFLAHNVFAVTALDVWNLD